jgi:uncharacterized protein GlcG (DUF336 family)
MARPVPGAALNHATADAALRAALTYAADLGLVVSVAVMDHLGIDVALGRADGATWFTPEVARVKARTAASFRRSSASLADMKAQHPELCTVVAATLAWTPTTLPGGVPLMVDEELHGAVGVSGAHPDDDVRVAEHAVAVARASIAGN